MINTIVGHRAMRTNSEILRVHEWIYQFNLSVTDVVWTIHGKTIMIWSIENIQGCQEIYVIKTDEMVNILTKELPNRLLSEFDNV